jgi:hypothetical protein
VKRFAACKRWRSSFNPLAGRKYASLSEQPESLITFRSTSNVPRSSISLDSRFKNLSLTSLPWCCLRRSQTFGCVARIKSMAIPGSREGLCCSHQVFVSGIPQAYSHICPTVRQPVPPLRNKHPARRQAKSLSMVCSKLFSEMSNHHLFSLTPSACHGPPGNQSP